MAFLELFGQPGSPMVLARLNPEAAKNQMRSVVCSVVQNLNSFNPDPDSGVIEEKKGGQLSVLVGKWCKDPKFWEWIMQVAIFSSCNEEVAARYVRDRCGVASRAELDHDAVAAHLFHNIIRIPYSKWLKE
jgi:hypothetical protein